MAKQNTFIKRYPNLVKVINKTWGGILEPANKGKGGNMFQTDQQEYISELEAMFTTVQLGDMEEACKIWPKLYAEGIPFLSEIVLGHHGEQPDVDSNEEAGNGVLLLQILANNLD